MDLKDKFLNSSAFESLAFNNEYLQPDTSNSSSYLKEISFNVPVKDLYKAKSSCAYNNMMNHQPIQFQIMEPYLKQEYNGNFLLQVWNKHGKVVFETVLKGECKLWAI
jgi:hypothetical protein